MAYDRQRAALALLCVVAVLFGASLFPATGFGTYPTRDAGGPTLPSDPSGGSGTAAPTPTSTPTATESGDATATPTDTTEAGGTPTERPADPVDDSASSVWGTLFWLVVAAIVAVVAATGLRARRGRRYPLLGMLPIDETALPESGLPGLLADLPRRTMLAVLGIGTSLSPVVDAFGSLSAGLAEALAAGGRGVARGLEVAAVGVPRALARGLGSLAGLGALAGLSGALSSIGDGVTSRDWSDDDEATTDTGTDGSDPEPVDPGPPDVAEAWDAMTDEVRVAHRRAATPADYARAAVEQGFPADAVETLTTVFREVRYGNYPSSEARVQAAREAIAAIRRHLEVQES